ncbi:PepSY domain-containing protein [Colwelliaceae bacterium BS250]
MLFIGWQFIIWSVTGAYMVFFDIDYIHGDSLISNQQQPINPENINVSLVQLQATFPQAEKISLSTFLGQEVYRFSIDDDKHLVSAVSGDLLSPLSKINAIKTAQYYYTGDGDMIDVRLIVDNPPSELSRGVLPAWQINFSDIGSPSIYVSALTGEIVTKRHNFWRIFDWMFRFHVMDYEDSEVDNSLLLLLTILSLVAVFTGIILVYFRVLKKPLTHLKNLSLSRTNKGSNS